MEDGNSRNSISEDLGETRVAQRSAAFDGAQCDPVKTYLKIEVDFDRYAHFLDDSDLSEDQKRELLQTVWNVVCGFVALGFEVHPFQQAKNSCGEFDSGGPDREDSDPLVIDSSHGQLIEEFMRQNGPVPCSDRKGVAKG